MLHRVQELSVEFVVDPEVWLGAKKRANWFQMASAAPHLVLLNEVTALISVGRESDGWTEVRKFVNEQPIQRNSRSLARFNNDPRVSPGLAARDTVWER